MRTKTVATDADCELVSRVVHGDIAEFNCLVERYQRQVYNLAYRMTGNAEDAGDAVQETFLRAYGALGTFRRDANFLTWLYKICSNLCIDHLRSRRNKGTLSLEVSMEDGWEPAAQDRVSKPESTAISSAVDDVLHRAILDLPEKYRVVVVMRHLQDMSINEIADCLDLPPGTIKTHLFRAREVLRGRLGPMLEIEGHGK